MKQTALLLACLTALALVSCAKKSVDPKDVNFAIVTASKLTGRQAPQRSASALTVYSFGDIVDIGAASPKAETIDGISAHWFRDAKSGAWLFGGYLITGTRQAKSPRALTVERVRCNFVCGGLSCFHTFSAKLAGEYYVAPVALADYCVGMPNEKEIPCTGTVIGTYRLTQEGIEFNRPEKIAAFDEAGTWIANEEKTKAAAQYLLSKSVYIALQKQRDASGEYYLYQGAKNVSRIETRKLCADGSTKEVWTDFWTLE